MSQPIAYALTLAKDKRNFPTHVVLGGGTIFTQEAYLRRLELENLLYRKHLTTLEQDMYMRVLADVSNAFGVDIRSIEAGNKSAAKIRNVLSAQPKQSAVRGNTKQTKDVRVPKMTGGKPSLKHKIETQKAKQPPPKKQKLNTSPKAALPIKTKAEIRAKKPDPHNGDTQQQPRTSSHLIDLIENRDDAFLPEPLARNTSGPLDGA